ncbi:MAG: hypothetical protein Q8P41_17650 [Pseudomonadota bacterium]|nr:hypothetical protein [Pseudomonadota bacterium]
MDVKRVRGLRALVEDVVEHGTTAVERVHLTLAARPFAVLQAIPPLAAPSRDVHVAYEAWVSGVYGMVRVGNRVVGRVAEAVIDLAERREAPPAADPGARTLPTQMDVAPSQL